MGLQKSNISAIRQKLSKIDWQSLFFKLDVNEMALVFTDTVLDIFSNDIPNKIITCHDKDAAWITPQVKTAIKRNTRVYCKWNKRGRKPEEHAKVIEVRNQTSKLIAEAKNSYFKKLGNSLSDSSTGEKHFWNAFKKLSNKKKKSQIFLH